MYKIYGLSSFYIAKLPTAVTVVNYEVNTNVCDLMLFNTDDAQFMSGVKVAADIFYVECNQGPIIRLNNKQNVQVLQYQPMIR